MPVHGWAAKRRPGPGQIRRTCRRGITRLESAGEPFHALSRRPVGPALGADLTLHALLNPVIAHGSGCVDRFLDLVGEEHAFIAKRIGPHPRETVGLKLHLNREGVALGL